MTKNLKRPNYAISRSSAPEFYAKRIGLDDQQDAQSDELLDTQEFQQSSYENIRAEIEADWNAEKKKVLEPIWKKEFTGRQAQEIRHSIRLDMQEENRKFLAAEEKRIEARLVGELKPKIIDQVMKQLRMKLQAYMYGKAVEEIENLKAAHKKELELVKTQARGEYEEKLKELRMQYHGTIT